MATKSSVGGGGSGSYGSSGSISSSGGSGGYLSVKDYPTFFSPDPYAWSNPKTTYLPDTAGLQHDQQNWQGQQNQADRDLSLALANLPLDWQKQKYGTVMPMAQDVLNNKPSMGSSSAAPEITQGGVWSPQQIDQQVNQAKASNAQQTATTQRSNAAKTAGQGYGSQSPLLAALNNAAQASMMGTNASSEQGIRWNAAQGNADTLLKQQAQASSNWSEAQDQDIRRKQSEYQAQSSLLQALAGYL